MEERYALNKNGEGYTDNTAYKAIRNVSMTDFLFQENQQQKKDLDLGKMEKYIHLEKHITLKQHVVQLTETDLDQKVRN